MMDESDKDGVEEPGTPQNLLDTVIFGRCVRSLRILRGFDRITELTVLLRTQHGVMISDRSLYAIERGEQTPSLDLVLALVCTLHPEPHYFDPAVRADCAKAMRRYREIG